MCEANTDCHAPPLATPRLVDPCPASHACDGLTTGPSVFLDGALARMLELTSSEYGFVADVFRGPGGMPSFLVRARSGLGWTDAMRRFYDELLLRDPSFTRVRARFDRVTVTADGMSADAPKYGVADDAFPPGHPSLTGLLAIGVGPGSERPGAVVIANSPRRYGDDVAARLSPFVATVKLAFAADRAEAAQRGAEFRVRDAAVRAHAAASDFVSAIGYESITPVAVIVGSADVLSPESARPSAFQQIRSSAGDLRRLLHDSGAVSRDALSRMPVESEPVFLAEFLSAVLAPFRAVADAKGIRVESFLEPQVPECIRTDPMCVQHVIENLVDNAVKFTGRGGVVVRTRFHRPDAIGCAGRLRIEVADTGIGIRPERIPALFQAFAQVHDTSVPRLRGMGLGLAISRRLALALGGDLSVTSIPGVGSQFTLELPIVAAAAPFAHGAPSVRGRHVCSTASPAGPAAELAAPEIAGACPPRLAARRVLVISDDPGSRRILSAQLERERGDVQTAHDGPAALELVANAAAEGRPFAAVVIDLRSSPRGGFETAALLRGRCVTVPTVVVTARPDDQPSSLSRPAACDAVLVRPLAVDVLLATLVRLLVSPRPGTPSTAAATPPKAADADAVRAYVAQLPACAEEIRAARDISDSVELRILVHRLRRSASAMEFPALSERAEVVDQLIVAGAAPERLAEPLDALLLAMASVSA
ncbi:MAG: hybrid sensor histidine kinase/response regulator [Planctomycetes bacterium]|nr:hybrid sensor histidine kinase/response regulator [Planctomycetota bacterium]